MSPQSRDAIVARLRGDIHDAVPDDNDMQAVLTEAAALIESVAAAPVTDREGLACWLFEQQEPRWVEWDDAPESTKEIWRSQVSGLITAGVVEDRAVVAAEVSATTLVHGTQVPDQETRAELFNDGFDAAMVQQHADDPGTADEWLMRHDLAVWSEGFSYSHWIERGYSRDEAIAAGVPGHLVDDLPVWSPYGDGTLVHGHRQDETCAECLT